MASRVIVIHPGEQIVLPSGTVIDSLILDGAISVTSTCDNLPTPESQKCYKVEWSVSETGNATLDQEEGSIQYVMIGGVQYDIALESLDPGLSMAFQNISNQIPGVFDFVDLGYADLANRKDFTLLFKSVPSIASEIEINIIGDGFPTNGLFVKPFESEDCP